VSGNGGLSGPLAPLSSQPFWWIDTTGTANPGLPSYGFNPLVPEAEGLILDPSQWTGSTLLSNAFNLNAGDTLSVTSEVFTNASTRGDLAIFDEIGFAILLQNSNVVSANLFETRSDGAQFITDFHSRTPGTSLAPPSPGVTQTFVTGDFITPSVTLGGITYGPPSNIADCLFNCSTQVTSSFTPGAGTYQLLFGAIMPTSDVSPVETTSTALAVQSVSVPEPDGNSSVIALILALAIFGLRLRSEGILHQ
jgi:hypothetical protein